MVGLGDLPGGLFESHSEGISRDGSIIVGGGASAAGYEAFRWTPNGGMVGLGDLPGGTFASVAAAISADGSVIIGRRRSALGDEAFRWTSGGGMQNLRELLIDGGAAGLTGWRLTEATAISADGRTIVGYGRNPLGRTEAWLAVIPEPASLFLCLLGAPALLLRRVTKSRNTVVVAVVVAVSCTVGQAVAVTFTPLDDLPGGSFISGAAGLSADGLVVLGDSSSASGFEAFRWTRSSGIVGMGDLPGGTFASESADASADGSVVVGYGRSASGDRAFRWTSGGGMVDLGELPGGESVSYAFGVSDNGSVVVGQSNSASGLEAFRWTSGGGMVGLGDLAGGVFASTAEAVSGDGSVVVGVADLIDDLTSTAQAFRWTSAEGMVGLGDLPGGAFASAANGVSADGSVIVGNGRSALGIEAFRWTAAGGMVGLGDLPGGSVEAGAFDVSADGSTIVGYGTSALGREAFLWTSGGGMKNLRQLLIAGGATGLSGWTLTQARAISADGRVIAGFGRNPAGNSEAWIAVIPEPSSLLQLAVAAVAIGSVLRRRATPVVGCFR
jgi:probable HAF family extracellular repeat protein